MPKMTENDETPTANFLPSPPLVLRWIAAAGDAPWFPSQHANQANVPRDAIDEPLTILRNAGMIYVRDWVKGFGQGYGITPEGRNFLGDDQKLILALNGTNRVVQEADAPTRYDRGEEARSALLDKRPKPAVPVLLLLNCFWFLVGLVLTINAGKPVNTYLSDGDYDILVRLGAINGISLLQGEWWRILSNAFVHIGGLHLFMNMIALFSIGSLTESIWGHWRFLVIYFASAIGASCLAMAIEPFATAAGASGAIWGLIGSLLVWLIGNREHLPPQLLKGMLNRVSLLVVLGVGISFLPGVGWAAHLGGAIMGFLLGAVFVYTKRKPKHGRWLAILASVLLTTLAIVGLVIASHRTESWKKIRIIDAIHLHAQFFQSFVAEYSHVEISKLDSLYRQTMDVVHLNVQHPNLTSEIQTLKDHALNFQTKLKDPASRGRWKPQLIESFIRYTTAVSELCDLMLQQLQNPNDSILKLKEQRRAVDTIWAQLHNLSD